MSFQAQVGPAGGLPAVDEGVKYPRELGVKRRFKGNGMIVLEKGEEPTWVDGELLVLDPAAKLVMGAPLAFVWATQGEDKTIVLFKRVVLSDPTAVE